MYVYLLPAINFGDAHVTWCVCVCVRVCVVGKGFSLTKIPNWTAIALAACLILLLLVCTPRAV